MNFTTHRSLRTAALAFGPAPTGRHRLLVASLAATIGVGVSTPVSGAAMAADGGGLPRDLRVGHMVQTIDVPGSFCMRNATSPDCLGKNGENRPVDVHVWYPADVSGFVAAPKTVYTSWLYGKALTPGPWDPLSWRVESEVAHEN